MESQKTIKSFLGNIAVLVDDFTAAGFETSNDQAEKQMMKFTDSQFTDGFINLTCKPSEFLEIIFPNFNPTEIKELSSFLVFMASVFGDETYSVKNSMSFSISFDANEFSITSEIFYVEIKADSFAIRGNNLAHVFIRPLDTDFHDILYSLKKSFKRNVNMYFEDVMDIDNKVINTIVNEGVDDYFWRKNDADVLNRITDLGFVQSAVEFGKNNVVRSKMPSLDIYSQNYKMNIKKMYNSEYAKEIERDLNSDHVVGIKFAHPELRHIKPLLKSLIKEKDLDLMFQIIELYVFKMKIENKITDNDVITIIRNHITTLEKASLLNHCYLKISIFDLHISFSDIIEVEERVFRSHKTSKFRSDGFENLYETYKHHVISSIEQMIGLPKNEINNSCLLVHQMAVI
jgi:hypothetical protein